MSYDNDSASLERFSYNILDFDISLSVQAAFRLVPNSRVPVVYRISKMIRRKIILTCLLVRLEAEPCFFSIKLLQDKTAASVLET